MNNQIPSIESTPLLQNESKFQPLAQRTIVLLANLAIFYAAFVAASGKGLPTGGLESVWLLSAAALWFLTLLSSPWFLPPRDSVANAIGAVSVLVTIDLATVAQFQPQLNQIRWIGVTYCVAVVALSLIALFLHDRDRRSPGSRLTYKLVGIFGRGEVLYTIPAMISIVGAYQASFATMAWLLLLWTLFVVARPIESGFFAWRQWLADTTNQEVDSQVGTIARIDHPNILRVKLSQSSRWKPGSLHVAAMPDGEQRFVVALFLQTQGLDVIGTGLCVSSLHEPIVASTGQVMLSPEPERAAEFIENLSGTKGSALVGFIVENSTIAAIRFEIAVTASLEEGEVVFARLDGRDIFYQILDAETSEESFDQNPRGTHIVRAAQLGNYDEHTGFTKYPWLPAMNTPLFAAKARVFPPAVLSEREFSIGSVPSTNINVAANIDDLLEYHTAILGVTGTGKTELALDVVREATQRGVKVFCVDLTGEYRQRLDNLSPELPSPTKAQADDFEKKLFAVETGAYGAPAEKKVLKEAIDGLRVSTREQVKQFLEGNEKNLAILELAEITNTKASLRVTELYLSTIMDWARANRRARQILIVLEEAHTIIPETHGSGFDSDTQWVVSRIGQIALQGRKYGVGLLVVTQRTALVSKTILSQCNTFFTHSLIDQTSLNFLESVYSSQHTRLIPNLANLHFLAFGKALRAERPILLRREFDPAKKAASDQLRKPLVV
jgi:uncharacterized protein